MSLCCFDGIFSNGTHFKKEGIFLALKGRNIPAQGKALGNTLQLFEP